MTHEQRVTANRWAKRIAVWLWYAINVANAWIAFRHHATQFVVSIVFLCSFIPYVVYLRWLQPRLTNQTRRD